ncbi:hypothetical protein ABT263_06920 [Kitasatospora sp. NPDC001603]|uniref:effector-associated constant component EACC1 n=1 Tax=Kitasatospora sp. NPDC001603 TaxID=3154388 RepID=UPI00331B71A7
MASPLGATRLTVTVLDDDPLREARDLRSLQEALTHDGVPTETRQTRIGTPDSDSKGPSTSEILSLIFEGSGLGIAAIQLWLSRVPARRLRIERADGSILEIDGRTQREDADVVKAFCASDAPREVEGS